LDCKFGAAAKATEVMIARGKSLSNGLVENICGVRNSTDPWYGGAQNNSINKGGAMDPDNNPKPQDEDINPDEVIEDTRQDPLNTDIGDDPLDEDNDRPASDADDIGSTPATDDTHPSTDTDVDETERYDQGL
jgi:hypothetical protein